MSNTAFPTATIVGYPRVGRFRELKKAQEAFWKGKATLQELQDTAADVQRTYFERVTAAGLKADNYSIPATFSYYDQVMWFACSPWFPSVWLRLRTHAVCWICPATSHWRAVPRPCPRWR